VPISESDQPDGTEVTVKVVLYAVFPETVTENVPDVAPEGTTAVIVVEFQVSTTAAVPFKETVPVVPKLVPVI
jgi:hypothetical protein